MELDIHDYSNLAEEYDEIRYTSPEDQYIDSLREKTVLKMLKPQKDMHILDVGTGTGSGMLFLSPFVNKITGVDATQKMLDKAKEKLDQANISNYELILANALEIPFADNSFDAVISLNFVHLFAPKGILLQKKFIAEMERVVKPHGKVLVEIDNKLYQQELGNKYSQIRKMSSMKLQCTKGSSLPVTKKLYKINKPITNFYAFLPHLPIIKFFSHRWIVTWIIVKKRKL